MDATPLLIWFCTLLFSYYFKRLLSIFYCTNKGYKYYYFYFKDPAKYKNKPKTLSEKMGRDEGPKYKFRRMRREAAKPEGEAVEG
jgi:hypothetical protein